MNLILVNIIW